MAPKSMSDDLLTQTVAMMKAHGSQKAAAEALGVSRSTFRGRFRRAVEKGLWNEGTAETDTYSRALLPPSDEPIETIVEQLTSRFEKRKQHVDAKAWQRIRMKSDEPIGLLWFGDPHLDDNFCDWPTLRRHVELVQQNDGVYGCGLGDYQNNWVGRLSRLYAEQDTSHETAWRLVEWFVKAINPLILIGGNHDMWTGSGDPLKWMTEPHSINEDWAAKVAIKFPNGQECKVHAAHDMPGHSQWNPLHGQKKMAMFKSNAHLYIAGHKHNWELAQMEQVDEGHVSWLARARGYKSSDTYALVRGYDEQNYGQAILQVINPKAESPEGFSHCFVDVETGVEFLNFLRSKG
tara:strand:+ start:860 stop:1903 length:1044 start_codon:yes stop_codon:yes gene_type:complete